MVKSNPKPNYTVNLKTTLGVEFAYIWCGPIEGGIFHFTMEIDNSRDGNFEGGFPLGAVLCCRGAVTQKGVIGGTA